MKHHLCILLIISIFSFSFARAEQANVSLSDAQGIEGAIITLSCTLQCDMLHSANFYLTFDPNVLEFIAIANDNTANITQNTGLTIRSNAYTSPNSVNRAGYIGVALFQPDSNPDTSYFVEPTPLFSLKFRLLSNTISNISLLFDAPGLRSTKGITSSGNLLWSTTGGNVTWIQQIIGSTTVILPDGLQLIETSAFENCTFIHNIHADSENLLTIQARAFAGCSNLQNIYLGKALEYIDPNAFEGCTNVILHCHAGSFAESFAIAQHLPYMIIEE